MLQSVIYFGEALMRHKMSGLPLLGSTAQETRLQICDGCDFRVGGMCSICGCFLKIKSKLPLESCPSGYWPALYTAEEIAAMNLPKETFQQSEGRRCCGQ